MIQFISNAHKRTKLSPAAGKHVKDSARMESFWCTCTNRITVLLWQTTTLLAYTKGINQNKYTMIIDTASIYQYMLFCCSPVINNQLLKQSSFFNVEMMQNNDLVIKQNIYLFNLKTSPINPVKAHIIHIESVTYNSGLV